LLGGVAERAEHAGYVAERGSLDPPLPERARGLSLEVDDQEVASRVQHLPKMEVAVGPDPLPTDGGTQECPRLRKEILLSGQKGRRLGDVPDPRPEDAERVRLGGAQRLHERALVECGERL